MAGSAVGQAPSETYGRLARQLCCVDRGSTDNWNRCAPPRSFGRARVLTWLVKAPAYLTRTGKEKSPMAKSRSSSRVTSKGVARKASAVLRDGRSSARNKSVAASALSQRAK